MPADRERPLFWLSRGLSIVMSIPASAAGGYVLAVFLGHWIHWKALPAAGILVGMAAGLTQVVRELTRLK